MELTPIISLDGTYIKRDDLFEVAEVCGGKARTCWHLAQGARGLVTAGSRYSPQIAIVASIAAKLGLPCHVHVPTGQSTPMIDLAISKGAEVIRHSPGYNGVIVSRAREDAKTTGFTNIPFGMECEEAVVQTASQVANIPTDVKRLVIPVGSGMSLAGVLTGLRQHNLQIPVLGIVVGADPTKRLNKYAPLFWPTIVTLVKSRYDYSDSCSARIGDITLDGHYEAKCVEYVQPQDLFWIVGRRP